jgi:hypothetical protein
VRLSRDTQGSPLPFNTARLVSLPLELARSWSLQRLNDLRTAEDSVQVHLPIEATATAVTLCYRPVYLATPR